MTPIEYIERHESFFDPRRRESDPKPTGLSQRQRELVEWLELARAAGGKYLILQARDVGVTTALLGWGLFHEHRLPWISRKLEQMPVKLAKQYPGCELASSAHHDPAIAVVDWVEYIEKPIPDAHCVIMTGGLNALTLGLKFDGVFVMHSRSAQAATYPDEHLLNTTFKELVA